MAGRRTNIATSKAVSADFFLIFTVRSVHLPLRQLSIHCGPVIPLVLVCVDKSYTLHQTQFYRLHC